MKYLVSAIMVLFGIKGLASSDGLTALIALISFTAGLAISFYGFYQLKEGER